MGYKFSSQVSIFVSIPTFIHNFFHYVDFIGEPSWWVKWEIVYKDYDSSTDGLLYIINNIILYERW